MNNLKPIDIDVVVNHDKEEFIQYSNMLSKTIHDINNPLAVFIGQISILEILLNQDPIDMDKLLKVISKFQSSAHKFNERLFDLRNFYKVPTNDSEYRSVRQVLNSLHYYFENLLFQNNIKLNIDEVPKDIQTIMPINELFIVLKHLIQNAIIASKEASENDIDLHITMENEMLLFSVIDHGYGFPKNISECVDPGTSHWQVKRPGIGLSIVYNILSSHNAKLVHKRTKSTNLSFFLCISNK